MSEEKQELDKLLTNKQTANILGLSVATVNNWRYQEDRPLPYVKVGRAVRYRLSDVQKYIQKLETKGIE